MNVREHAPTGRSLIPAWWWRAWAVVAIFGVVTVVRSLQVGIPLRDPHGSILVSRIGISLAMLVVYVLVDALLAVRRRRRPWRETWSVVESRWDRRRLALVLTGLLAYHLVYFCYHNLKSWDVLLAPRDSMLLAWDRWLFLGHSPAVLIHDLLGQTVAMYVLMTLYESFSTIVLLAIPAPLVFVRDVRRGWVAMAAGLWIWILGTASYYSIPTLGPFWSAPQEFSGLPHTMIQDTQARYLAQRAHLLAHPEAHDAFAQVSAFASLHVGVTTVIVLLLRYYGVRWAYRVGLVFLGGTIVATVYLGWHFFVDDIAGLAIGYAAVWLGRRTVYWGGEPPARTDTSSPTVI